MNIKNNNLGFSLIEIIIVIAILAVLSAIIFPNLPAFKNSSDLNNIVQEFVSTLKLAQNKTVISENYSQYGIYINTGVSPNTYVLFKGASYAGRDIPSDKTYTLQDTIEFYDVNLGGGNEIVFDKLTGASEESGSISVRVKSDANKNKTIYISSSGSIGYISPGDNLDASRITDTRHVQLTYSRYIDTTTEVIKLTFDNNQTTTVPISAFINAGEIKWGDTIDVSGRNQVVRITTQGLNINNVTIFNIYRDRRYNDKSLKIAISGDTSGDIIEYPSDGATFNHASTYVSNSHLQ